MADLELLSVTCNHCGGPLQVPPDARFITCAHCGSRLEVHRTGSAVYTQVLDAIDQRTQRIEQDVQAIKRQNELEQLDREWQMRREQYLTRDRNGNTVQPGAGGGIVILLGSLLVGAFGIFWTVSLLNAGGPPMMALFGVVFTIAAVGGGIFAMVKTQGYREAEQAYQRERARLLQGSQPPQQPNP